jgi:hypothetical protein
LANLIFALNYFSVQKSRVETGLPGNNAGNICSGRKNETVQFNKPAPPPLDSIKKA